MFDNNGSQLGMVPSPRSLCRNHQLTQDRRRTRVKKDEVMEE